MEENRNPIDYETKDKREEIKYKLRQYMWSNHGDPVQEQPLAILETEFLHQFRIFHPNFANLLPLNPQLPASLVPFVLAIQSDNLNTHLFFPINNCNTLIWQFILFYQFCYCIYH